MIHPNIVKYQELIKEKLENDYHIYNVVMELVEGKNLARYIKGVGQPKLT